MAKILEVQNLIKSYDNVKAIQDISFNVEEGSFFSFLGHNGAGKSTTINIICTLLSKNSGTVRVAGYEVGKDDDLIRKNIGVVFQDSLLDRNLTVSENLRLRASFYGLSKEDIENRLNELTHILDISDILNRRYGKLSGGQKRKIDIARALVNRPRLLILDEPTTGLDPKTRVMVWETLRKLKEETNITIFLTTHYMDESLQSDKIIIIDEGKIVAEGTPEELRSEFSNDVLKLYHTDNRLKDELDSLNINYKVDRDLLIVNLKNSKEGLNILNKLKFLNEFEIVKGNMDQVFINVTGRVGEK
jgi:ABC-type multidrug transport system ATPase subunit